MQRSATIVVTIQGISHTETAGKDVGPGINGVALISDIYVRGASLLLGPSKEPMAIEARDRGEEFAESLRDDE